MFEDLEKRFEGVLRKMRGESRFTEENIAEATREIRRALLEADVELGVAKGFVAKIKERSLGQEVLPGVTPGQHLVKVMHDSLVETLGGTAYEPQFGGMPPAQILLCGLQGSGKTTSAAKLALYLRTKRRRKPMLVACDVYRPAAIDQLVTLGKSLGIPVYFEKDSRDPLAIAKRGRQKARDEACDTVIYDTAGRLQIDEPLMDELAGFKRDLSPNEILFVADSMTGQEAVRVAKVFHDRLGITGVVLTKTDGDARGGAALSLVQATGARLCYVGTGETPPAFELFDPERMANRILGMGDIVGLVEKAQEVIDQEEAERLQKKFLRNKFDLDDMLSQLRQVRKMGNLADLVGMLPGGSQLKEKVNEIDPKQILHVEAVLSSMTPQERKQPKLINGSRRSRIAKGSGTSLQEVNQVLRQYDQMRELMSKFGKMGGKIKSMQKAMKAGGRMPPGMGGMPGMPPR